MTITSANNKNQYTANGVNDTFAYTFKIFKQTEILVDVGGVTQTITTNYTVTGVGNAGGGNVVFTSGSIPASAAVVTLTLNPDFTQDIDYVENDDFPASSHEEGLDRSLQRDLNLSEQFSRSLLVPLNTVSTFDGTLPTPVANLALKWNATADGFVNSTVDPDTQTTAAATSATAAASSATSASSSASAAASSATASANSATAAATSATAAASSATAAAASAALFDTVATITSSSSAITANLSSSRVFKHTTTENTTFTFSNPASSGTRTAFELWLFQGSTGRTITWPSSVKWSNGTAPTITTANKNYIINFRTIDGGTTYVGTLSSEEHA